MNDRQKYAEVRQQLIDAIKVDLIGPESENEILEEPPTFAYLIGMLYPRGVETFEKETNTR